jgi:putative CocE/NonD family hydrolase
MKMNEAHRGVLRALAALWLGWLVMAGAIPAAAVEPVASSGYIPLSDGVQLRYSLYLPPGEGPFPATLVYSGYNAGNNPYDISFGSIGEMLLERGIAVIGVSLRGTGCSQGVWVPFASNWGPDGAEVVDWIAQQPWSDGHVAMAGVSFPAILSLVTAIERPPALRAILPMVPLGELYRDVAYPGGLFNLTFASAWTLMQNVGTPFSLFETLQGDTRCGTAILGQNDPRHVTVVEAARIPYTDSDERYQTFLSPELFERIEVPVLGQVGWQDEQLGSRAWHAFERLDPAQTWMLGVNGAHGTIVNSARFRALAADFLEHFLRGGRPQDFDAPRLQIWKGFSTDFEPAVIETYERWPLQPETLTLHAQPDGSLRPEPPASAGAFSYLYPLPAPSTLTLILVPNPTQLTYLLPVVPGGSVALTTPVLAEDLRVYGRPGLAGRSAAGRSRDVRTARLVARFAPRARRGAIDATAAGAHASAGRSAKPCTRRGHAAAHRDHAGGTYLPRRFGAAPLCRGAAGLLRLPPACAQSAADRGQCACRAGHADASGLWPRTGTGVDPVARGRSAGLRPHREPALPQQPGNGAGGTPESGRRRRRWRQRWRCVRAGAAGTGSAAAALAAALRTIAAPKVQPRARTPCPSR